MKKKLIITAVILVCVIIAASLMIYGRQNREDKVTQWGEELNKDYESGSSESEQGKYKLALAGIYAENTEDAENIYAAGNDILITDDEIEKAKEYFVIAGDTAQEAESKAVDYVEKENALYVEAIENGFDVTEEEVAEYIEELKESIEDSANKDEAKEVMTAFDSEEEYWEYEYQLYKKLLPIQNYVKSLENKYINNHSDEDSETVEEKWEKKFEKMKEKLAEEQEYEIVNGESDIDRKFAAE